MAYHFNRNKKSIFLSGTFLIGTFFVVVIVILFFVFKNSLFKKTSVVTAGTIDLIHAIVDRTTPKSVLLERQKLLVAENQRLTEQLSGMQLTEDENTSLRSILDYPKLGTTTIVARIISKPSQSLYDRVMIDRGANDGIIVGDKIISGENSYIATIDQVGDTTASGTLISGSYFKGDAAIARLGITVPVIGKGSGNFELHVPRDLDVRDGDIMTLPGGPDLVIGIVKTIQFDERDPYKTVLARTPVNVQELKFVRIVK
jgi:cell shape-determining protein MreC